MQYFRTIAIPVAAALWLGACFAPAQAEPVKILAFGASNTNGKGVGSASAWPAHLGQMLKKKGHDIALSVSAVDGEISSSAVARIQGAIAPGTKVVVYQVSRSNDARAGASATDANAAKIEAIIRARGAVPIRADAYAVVGQPSAGNPNYQPDGIHLTAAAHQRLAASLVSRVIKAIGEKKG